MIIGFTGLAGSGKSTAADYLVKRHGFVRTRFADTLKGMMRVLGLGDAEIEGHLKEVPCPILMGKTPRWAMQSLGTEWGRNCIDRDIWIALWQRTTCDILDHGGNVVVDDCRFDNEFRMLEKMDAKVCRIIRAGAGTASTHVSEQGVFPVAYEIQNNGSIAALHDHVDALVSVAAIAA